MKNMKRKLLAALVSISMVLSMVMPAVAAPTDTLAPAGSATYTDLQLIDSALVINDKNADDTVTVMEAVTALLQGSGLDSAMITNDADITAMAESLGMIEAGADTSAAASTEQLEAWKLIYDQLSEAVKEEVPLFLNGMAQPVFPYTSGADKNYKNENSDIIRYFVWVETDYDTDNDGKRDMVKALVQMPRSAAEGNYKAATIFEARPYITGCTPFYGDDVDPRTGKPIYGTEGYDLSILHNQPAKRSPDRILKTWNGIKDLVNAQDPSGWYYYNEFEDLDDYEDLDWYDYYLVRGFAVVESGGIGTRDSEGFETCGTDLEIASFKNIIEWIHGDRPAYMDKAGTTAVDAYWANGKVGMTGRSYAGTTQFGLATTGVAGLETIVPVAGIASWYEYTNSQGISTDYSPAYSDMLAVYCAGRYLDAEDYALISESYGNYLYQVMQNQLALNGDYSNENDTTQWSSRDYTLDADKIKCSALIVHGVNDYNVRTKEFQLMYDSFKQASANVKLLLHQDGHLTPTYPAGELSFMIGEESYDSILNKWFSHYLYDLDNGAEDMAAVTAQDAHSNTWNTYDSWDAVNSIDFACEDGGSATISSDLTENNVSRRNYTTVYTSGSTTNNAMFVAEVDQDAVLKGVPAISFRASVANKEAAADSKAPAAPKGDPIDLSGLDHDNYVNPNLHQDNVVLPDNKTTKKKTPGSETLGRDALMVSAMLVDLSDTEFDVFNTSGSYVKKNVLSKKGYWQAGNIKKFDLVEMTTSKVKSKIVSRGWMDLCNPGAGFASNTANVKVDLVDGKYYDYTIYLQPNLYKVEAGHKLAVVLFAQDPSIMSYKDNYTITIDKSSVKADLPVEGDAAELKAVYSPINNSDSEVKFTIEESEGGSVESDIHSGTVTAGTTVNVTAAAAKGYEFENWTVNGEDYSTSVSEKIKIDADTVIKANFKKSAPAVEFEDVPEGKYYTDAVKWAVDNEITLGTSETTFSPDLACTRGQIVTFLWRMAGCPVVEAENPFTDVAEKDYFYNAVLWAVENNITTGVTAAEFAPKQTCTRGQAVTFMWRAAGMPEVSAENPFTDVAEKNYFYKAVLWAVENNITNGMTETEFGPKGDCTRAQIVTFLYRSAK